MPLTDLNAPQNPGVAKIAEGASDPLSLIDEIQGELDKLRGMLETGEESSPATAGQPVAEAPMPTPTDAEVMAGIKPEPKKPNPFAK